MFCALTCLRNRFDGHCADFIIRDFCIRIASVEGEFIGRGLSKVEGDEDRTPRGTLADQRLNFNLAAAGADAYPRVFLDPEPLRILGVDFNRRFRVNMIEL